MERYNYLEEMAIDIIEYIKDNYTNEEIIEKLESRDEWAQELHADLWTVDSVTGNASGSYYCNSWKAEEAIAHNLDLLGEALEEFCDDCNALQKGAEWCDVTIRCYLLYRAIENALDELEEENK
jgi:molybdenum cofactor biosynthesis enzyme MoaA